MSHFITLVHIPEDEAEYAVTDYIDSIMEPFCQVTEDWNYLEFHNATSEITESYKTQTCDCVRMSGGKIITCYDPLFYCNYTTVSGVIYQKSVGKSKQLKRTQKAEKLKLLPNYPVNKVYKTIEQYAEDYCDYKYNEDEDAYGYYDNPNGMWDWYQIGGRWLYKFLVSETAKQVITGEKSWALSDETPETPNGYKWVAGAKKSDIELELMKSLKVDKTARITSETLDLYADLTDSYIQNGEFYSDFGAENENEWAAMVKEYIDGIADNDFITVVDCHV